MRTIRLFHPEIITGLGEVTLSQDAQRHLVTVLRAEQGQSVELFDGSGHLYQGFLSEIGKKKAAVQLTESSSPQNESPIHISLFQAVSRGEKMDLTIQKAVELGVSHIVPILSERCGVKLNAQRWDKKIQHWHKVAVSACEQSGRVVVPTIGELISFDDMLNKVSGNTLILDPIASMKLSDYQSSQNSFQVLVGPEGGFTQREIDRSIECGATGVAMGPRILRTETAGLAVVSVLQAKFGDW